MFISPAFAQAADVAATTGSPAMGVIVQFGLIFAVFYFLLIRPQSQKAKQHNMMLENIKKGDTVITAGGIIAKVAKVIDEDEITVELNDTVKVKIMKRTIRDVLNENGASKLGEKIEVKAEEKSSPNTEENKAEVKSSKSKTEALKKALSD